MRKERTKIKPFSTKFFGRFHLIPFHSGFTPTERTAVLTAVMQANTDFGSLSVRRNIFKFCKKFREACRVRSVKMPDCLWVH